MTDHYPPRKVRRQAIPRPGPGRREFLQRAAMLGVGAPTLAALIAACTRSQPSSTGGGGSLAAPGSVASSGSASATSSGGLTLAAPTNPVLWPIAANNVPISDGLLPEKNATLQLYNYADYIDPGAIKTFEAKYKAYNVKVSVSTFNDTDEAITKIRTGSVPYDIYFPSYDQISRLVAAELIRPLAHSYITNISNVWSAFTNPWYDQQWRYTVPYTVYTTGIGWRVDKVKTDIANLPNPYDTLWDPTYKGKTAVIDDWHTAMAMCLLRKGVTDINTADPANLQIIADELTDIEAKTAPKVTITMYNDLPAGQLGQCQMWSGDVVNALSYLPKGVSPNVLRYWFPSDGKGMVDNDLMVVLRGGKNPVLAHLFLQHMLDSTVASGNFSYIGYQPPQNSINPDDLVKQGFIPATLSACVVQEEYFDVGYRLLELSTANDAAWHKVWLAFNAGG
jgi:spermidine/putrescine transport system substrate-binding protein